MFCRKVADEDADTEVQRNPLLEEASRYAKKRERRGCCRLAKEVCHRLRSGKAVVGAVEVGRRGKEWREQLIYY